MRAAGFRPERRGRGGGTPEWEQIHALLLRWFNPDPQWVEKEVLYRTARHHDNPHNALPLMTDFSESLWFTPPRSDAENGVWWFDEQPHRAVTIDRLRRPLRWDI